MGIHLTPLEARTLVASALLLLLLVAGMAVYLIHRIFKHSRETPDFNPKSPRAENETGFAMATMQAVITRMKEQERELNELRRLAEAVSGLLRRDSHDPGEHRGCQAGAAHHANA